MSNTPILLVRNLLWIILLPGSVTLLFPYLLFRPFIIPENFQFLISIAIVLLLIGMGTLLWCVYDFATKGKGTLSPADPAKHLVINGLYNYSRNPMYTGVTTILLGESLLFASIPILLYALIVFILFNLFIRLHEEPYLKTTFGEAYENYCKRVRRWL